MTKEEIENLIDEYLSISIKSAKEECGKIFNSIHVQRFDSKFKEMGDRIKTGNIFLEKAPQSVVNVLNTYLHEFISKIEHLENKDDIIDGYKKRISPIINEILMRHAVPKIKD